MILHLIPSRLALGIQFGDVRIKRKSKGLIVGFALHAGYARKNTNECSRDNRDLNDNS